MNHEINVLEHQEIPHLERCRAAIQEVLNAESQMLTDHRREHEARNATVAAAAHNAMTTHDSAIATRIMRGGAAVDGVDAALGSTYEHSLVAWRKIFTNVRRMQDDVVEELRTKHRRLEELKAQERARSRR